MRLYNQITTFIFVMVDCVIISKARLCGFVLVGLATVAHAQGVNGVAAPLGEPFKVPRLLSKQQSRVVFYRLNGDANKAVATVYVDGAYQGSLQPGGFTQVCLSPRTIEVAVRTVENEQQMRDAHDVVNTLMLEPGQDVFVRVSYQTTGRAVLMSVKPEMALPELVKTRAQQHTLSRVPGSVACKEDPTRLKTPDSKGPVRMQTTTLEGDALFPFGKTDVDSIPLKGRRLLDLLIERIKTEFGADGRARILIVGHTDSLASEAANMKLSKNRAQAIKAYFVRSGLPGDRIKTEGRADTALVVTHCGTKVTEANVACHKPNRRVVVTVLGSATHDSTK
jgi:OmpA-OmpF porin, OOP family